MSIGDPLFAEIGTNRLPLVGTPIVSPKEAASKVLAAYLGRLEFTIAPGDDGKCVKFRLNEVLTQWPSPGYEIPYPAASIDEGVVVFEEHNLTPSMLEETHNCYGQDTVLWKTSEVGIDFQVDFWTNTEGAREAIRAGLPRMFSPTEGRSGIMLQGDPDYFDRSVRATYRDADDVDDSDTVFERERRVRVTMRCDMDVVHLRSVNVLQPKPIFTITDNS